MSMVVTTPLLLSGAHTADLSPALYIHLAAALCPGAADSISTVTGLHTDRVEGTSRDLRETTDPIASSGTSMPSVIRVVERSLS